MRQIKFRAKLKRSDGTKYIFNQDNQYLTSFLRRVTSFIAWNEDREEGRHETYLERPLEEYLDRFTGLFDKNGKEIYEGDIVTCDCYPFIDEGKPNYNATVEWIFSQWQIVLHCVNPEKSGISDGINSGLNDHGIEEGEKTDLEVIGNIYENPELLTSKET